MRDTAGPATELRSENTRIAVKLVAGVQVGRGVRTRRRASGVGIEFENEMPICRAKTPADTGSLGQSNEASGRLGRPYRICCLLVTLSTLRLAGPICHTIRSIYVHAWHVSALRVIRDEPILWPFRPQQVALPHEDYIDLEQDAMSAAVLL